MAAGDYMVADDVKALLPLDVEINDTGSRPSLASVKAWITQVSQQVNVALTDGGASSVPTTEANLLGTLKLICSREVAYQVLVARGAVATERDKPEWVSWHKEFLNALKAIRDGDITISTDIAGVPPTSYTMDAMTSTDPSLHPWFEREKIF